MAREKKPDRRRRLAAFADPARSLAAARFFRGHLHGEQAKGFGAPENPLRFYLSACINFASGPVEALSEKIGAEDAGADEKWREQQNPDDLALFDHMRDVRIETFHYGVLDVKLGSKWVNSQRLPGVTIFSSPGVFVEERNPGGGVVRGAALSNVPMLYIEHGGKQIEATEACRRFISSVESLVALSLPAAGGPTPDGKGESRRERARKREARRRRSDG